MPRRKRQDAPGTHHHVMNRAIARRSLFETKRDMRFFLYLMAREVRRGTIRIFSFCLMTTHFHIHLESTTGELSACMQGIQTTYSRYFNRGRQRDGPLFRGRFSSKRVDSEFYRETLMRYIEENPVEAKLVTCAADYQFGSAFARAKRLSPRWLTSREVPGLTAPIPAEAYKEIAFLIEGRLSSTENDTDVDSLVVSHPDAVFDWMRQKSLLADGTEPGQPVCSPSSVLKAIALHHFEIEQFAKRQGPDADAIVRHMTTGLIRTLCGSRIRDIAAVTQRSQSASAASWFRFRQLIGERAEFAQLAGKVTSTALQVGPWRQIGLLKIT